MKSQIINPETISRFKKESYLKNLSEDDFRDQVVRPVFTRIGYNDGRDLCGPTEKGKDAVFGEKNKLGQCEYIAVQTKRGNLNLSSKATQNIISAISQLETALKTPIPLIKEKKQVYPSKVILCASGKINEAARIHITSQIQDTRIHFLDSDDLIPLVDQHYPEFWLGIEAELLPYLRALQRLIEGDAPDPNSPHIASTILSGAAGDQTYVELNLYNTKVVQKKIHGKLYKTHEIDEFPLQDIFKKNKTLILLLGEAGFGKSTALYRLAYISTKNAIQTSEDYRIPVIIRAPEFASQTERSIIEYADYASRNLANTDKACILPRDLEDGRIILLIDAIDEIPNTQDRIKLVNELKDTHKRFPKSLIIATSRPYQNVLSMKELESFFRVNIHPISLRQAERMITQVQKKKSLVATDSKELLRRLDEVHGIELSPLLVTVFAATTDLSRKDIPANITELFKKFTETMLGRWDEEKGLSQQYHAPLKDFLLQKLAYRLHREGATSTSLSKIKETITDELAKRGHSADIDSITYELMYRSGLFRILGEKVEFRHHLLQEFFAGRGISDTRQINELIFDEWWSRSIVFYFGENPSEISRLTDIATSISATSAEALLQSARTIGLSLQACYLSSVNDKIDLWKWVVNALAESEKVVLDEFSKLSNSKDTPITDFILYYLSGRDGVALANLPDQFDTLKEWASTDRQLSRDRPDDSLSFWLVAALIEIGRLDLAQEIIESKTLTTENYLLACHLGSFLAKEVRATEENQIKHAEKITNILDNKIFHLKQKLLDEFGSQLLEVRHDEVHALPQKSK